MKQVGIPICHKVSSKLIALLLWLAALAVTPAGLVLALHPCVCCCVVGAGKWGPRHEGNAAAGHTGTCGNLGWHLSYIHVLQQQEEQQQVQKHDQDAGG